MSKKTWGGRFKEKTDEALERFNASISLTVGSMRRTSRAARPTAACLPSKGSSPGRRLRRSFEAWRDQEGLDKGGFDDTYEDIHTLVEKALVDRVGPSARSCTRGEAGTTRLPRCAALREGCHWRVDGFIRDMQRALVILAEKNSQVIMPGYTHLQRAQPVLLSHHLLPTTRCSNGTVSVLQRP